LAERRGIQILNETDLWKLLEQTSARLDREILSILNDDRKVCPKCEKEMVLRMVTKGPNAGEQF